jgi:hypothetical protein
LRDWWTLLHPPYTIWHLSYVVIGACLAPVVNAGRLGSTLLGFFLAVGVAAHALDELHGRPLRTRIPAWELVSASVLALAASVAIGIAGTMRVGLWLLPFVGVGVLLVLGYNLELAGGVVHTDAGFAAAWGAFPVLTSYFAQSARLSPAAIVAAAGAFALSFTQRALSTRARFLRRRVSHVHGTIELADGESRALDDEFLLQPIEIALRSMVGGIAALAIALAIARLS